MRSIPGLLVACGQSVRLRINRDRLVLLSQIGETATIAATIQPQAHSIRMLHLTGQVILAFDRLRRLRGRFRGDGARPVLAPMEIAA